MKWEGAPSAAIISGLISISWLHLLLPMFKISNPIAAMVLNQCAIQIVLKTGRAHRFLKSRTVSGNREREFENAGSSASRVRVSKVSSKDICELLFVM